jgi:hypothetical protein
MKSFMKFLIVFFGFIALIYLFRLQFGYLHNNSITKMVSNETQFMAGLWPIVNHTSCNIEDDVEVEKLLSSLNGFSEASETIKSELYNHWKSNRDLPGLSKMADEKMDVITRDIGLSLSIWNFVYIGLAGLDWYSESDNERLGNDLQQKILATFITTYPFTEYEERGCYAGFKMLPPNY